ncbi:MAG: DUF2975 domain-containing protein [Oscillospiraceae bacterium]|nr:DUF2975 domain-containing protein [Oscillospiraceae bacterium]
MKVLGKNGLSVWMEKCCSLLFLLGIAVIAALPWLLKAYYNLKNEDYARPIILSMLVVLYISGAISLAILVQLRQILRDVNRGAPFTMENARRIKAVAWLCLPVSLLYFIGIFTMPSALVLLVALVFLFLAALTFVLAEVFRQAVLYKEENDLTI